MDKFQTAGWEFVGRGETRFRTQLTFRREAPKLRWGWWTPKTWLALLLAGVLVAALAVVVVNNGPRWHARYEAWAAVRALNSGDLDAVEKRLADNRGNPDFAYFFASKATPRNLGDALATVAGTNKDEPLKAGVDPHEYELILTDLAGTLGLASHGTGERALPESWTKNFIVATTNPTTLYGKHDGFFDKDGKRREKQDKANRANLVLLLSRGYWSSEFLQSVTKSYYDFDRKEGDDAWPDADPDDDVGYAPAPSGVYLTDGVLALTAALTANPAASEWAFTEFQPDDVKIDDTDYSIGKFTHYLMFEHEFPESNGESIGMTTTLTALSSAIDSVSWASGIEVAAADASTGDVGPMHDVAVLQRLAHDLSEGSDCSFNPLDYGHCVIDAAKAVWHWVQRWGHLVLDILTVATSFAPPPFNLLAVAPGALNATWYAIDGDYLMAGLSLAAAVPGLSFRKIAKGAKAAKGTATAAKAEKAAAKSDDIKKAAKRWRPKKPWKDCDLVPKGGLRLSYHKDWTRAQRKAADEKVKAYYELARQGKLVKTVPQRSGTTASSQYRKATGKDVKAGQDVDHIQDLQLGGADGVSNMKPLDKVVNASLGRQVALQIRDLNYGDPIPAAAIC